MTGLRGTTYRIAKSYLTDLLADGTELVPEEAARVARHLLSAAEVEHKPRRDQLVLIFELGEDDDEPSSLEGPDDD